MLRKSFIILFTILSYGYSYTISGFVKDSSNGEPLPYTNVIIYIDNELGEIPDDINGAASDVNGYFIIPGISDGDYIIKAMVIGYDSNEQQLTVNSNLKVNFELSPTPIEGKEIKVSAERMRFEKKVDISRVNLTNRDIRRTPAFIESDVFRTLQLLPSVNASNDFNAALIVRGGSPDENLILLDGTEVYNPYHIGGIFSTFNSDMIADTEFLAGGFPANYGGRLSSVLTITAREGDSKNGRLQSKFPTIAKYWDYSKIRGDISLLSSKFSTEGKILNGSWMLSGRRTYFDKFVDAYYDSQDETPPANYYFWDTHFKVKMPLSQNNQLMYSQFSGKDDLFVSLGGGDFPGVEFNWDWGNGTKSLNWRYIPNGSYIVNTSLSQTKYNFDVGFEIDFQVAEIDSSGTDIIGNSTPDLTLTVDNLVEDYDLKQNLKYIYNEDLTFEAGWQIKNLNLDYREFFAGRETARLQSKPKIYSSFINTTFKPMPLFYINAGVRTAKYNKYDKTMIDPKIGIKFNPTGNLALKFTIGQYSQFLYTINQEEELLRIVDFWQPIPDEKKPQQSIHYILGSEYWISDGNTISIETYYKDYSNIYDLNPAIDITNVEETIALSGTAKSFGIEFLYRLRLNKFTGWISYAYSQTERTVDLNSDGYIWDENEKYPAKYNKPHSFNSVISYQLNSRYSFGLSCVYGSGQTYTPVIGKVHQAGQQLYGSLENPYQYFGNIYGPRNSGTYPSYFRLDLSMTRKTDLFFLWEGDLKFQFINLTNHYNVLLYNWNHQASPSQVQAFSMFPFIFTVGWEFNL
tara:strand:- start:827 stop:3229 length:2403 start_codon:yes stop_codon:yes gene_type:complete